MSKQFSRRDFTLVAAALAGSATPLFADDKKSEEKPKPAGPVEANFVRDYPAPQFKPSWKKPQVNRLLVQDFVIYAHSDLEMTRKLKEKEPAVLNSIIDWGGGDWESALGAAAHMGRRDIAEYLLAEGARIDIFCSAMLGMLDVVKSFLTLQPKLIDAKGPHGFTLHFHAQVGGKQSEPVLDYLQSVKHIEMKPNPFLNMKKDAPAKK
ncbi:MAG TPA: ankyrin repeat domain-containing protein [Gemmatales bacterium]|nr:ankyrin repeat domain-containing protein [Gemmatales bacterium]